MVEQQNDKKGPFTLMQTGCAFLMLTNMLIYLGVIAFVFNMLDPGKLDPDYLAKRGFTTQTSEPEAPEDQAFRHLAEKKQKEQQEFYDGIVREAAQSPAKELSTVEDLSGYAKRSMVTSRPDEESPPSALQAPEPFFPRLNKIRAAKTLGYPPRLAPKITLEDSYIPYSPPEEPPHFRDGYRLPTFKLNAGFGYPIFSIPLPERTSGTIHTPVAEAPPAAPDDAEAPATSDDVFPSQSDTPETSETPE
ncbi:MAG: hypothetical protein H8E68_05680 [Kiritimatiellaeota bacterium]|nr:hypothetical protein [Kiritimatiellota bacterium]